MHRLFLHLKKPAPVQTFAADDDDSHVAGSSDPFSQSRWPSQTQTLGMHDTPRLLLNREYGANDDEKEDDEDDEESLVHLNSVSRQFIRAGVNGQFCSSCNDGQSYTPSQRFV